MIAALVPSCTREGGVTSDDDDHDGDAATAPPPNASLDARVSRDSGTVAADASLPGRAEAGSPEEPRPIADASSALPSDAGSPPNAEAPAEGSCFGRCGMPELLGDAEACACDPGCYTRGDCCADKHELCAVSTRTALCTLTGREIDRAVCGTDLGWSFVHDDKIEVMFGDSYGSDCMDPYPNDDSQATLPLARPALIPTQPSGPVACGSLLEIDKKPALFGGDTFAPILLYQNGAALSSFLGETPLTGFSDGEHAYLVARRGDTIDNPIYIGFRDPTAAPNASPARTIYRAGVEVDMPRFRNPTAVTVAHYDPAEPSRNDWSAGSHTLLLFGRGDFSGPNARDVYLAQHRLPLVQPDGSMQWTPSYFAGLSADGPTWTSEVSQAQPVLANDFQRTMQFDVAWFPELQKWVMLYGGDVADWIDAQTNSDQPRHGALHMRLADAPWGPWSAATPVFWREHAAAFMHCDAPAGAQGSGCDLDALPDDPAHSYAPGTWAPQLLDFPGCIPGSLTPSQPNFMPGSVVPCLGSQRGNLYGPSFLTPWTANLAGDQGYAHAATLYFVVSTWMPYQVILASLTVHLP